jgi:ferric-dicitrate binding protein FerR (iron transport regulator)
MSTSSDDVERLLRLAGRRSGAPPDREARVMAAVREEWRVSVERHARRRRRAAVALLATAAAIVVGLTLRPRPRPEAEVAPSRATVATLITMRGSVATVSGGVPGETLRLGDRIPAGRDLRVAAGGIAALTLEGGAGLRLDQETHLRFRSAGVVELLQGAVYFDSGLSPASSESIRIVTRFGTAEDVGTQFEARVFGDRLRVRVREGSVRVERDRESREAPAGVELVAPSGGPMTTQPTATYGPDWTWIGGGAPEFTLAGKPLKEFFDWYTRETGRRVTFEDSSMADAAGRVMLQGSISGIAPEESPAVVLPAAGLTFRVDGGALVIERR